MLLGYTPGQCDGVSALVAFPGGYGGLVTSDSDEVSFSCCITRAALALDADGSIQRFYLDGTPL